MFERSRTGWICGSRAVIGHGCAALLVFCVAVGRVAFATTIEDGPISVEIPDQWRVQNNKDGIILAYGARIVGNTPLPFLAIQYCGPATRTDACDQPCSDVAQNLLERLSSSFKLPEVALTPTEIQTNPHGVSWSRFETVASKAPYFAYGAISCTEGPKRIIYLSLVSDAPDEAKAEFDAILGSFKWR